MMARFIKGTWLSGKIIHEGTVMDLQDDVFRGFKLRGQAVEYRAATPEPAAPEPAPIDEAPKPSKRKR